MMAHIFRNAYMVFYVYLCTLTHLHSGCAGNYLYSQQAGLDSCGYVVVCYNYMIGLIQSTVFNTVSILSACLCDFVYQ